MARMCLVAAVILSVAALPMVEAHSKYWVRDRKVCRAPSLDDVIMDSPVVPDSANELNFTSPADYALGNEYVLTFASTRTRHQEYLVHISAGTFSNATGRAHLECNDTIVAWRRTEVASVTWTAPAEPPSTPVVLTITFAGAFEPVVLSNVTLQPASGPSTLASNTSARAPVQQFVLP